MASPIEARVTARLVHGGWVTLNCVEIAMVRSVGATVVVDLVDGRRMQLPFASADEAGNFAIACATGYVDEYIADEENAEEPENEAHAEADAADGSTAVNTDESHQTSANDEANALAEESPEAEVAPSRKVKGQPN